MIYPLFGIMVKDVLKGRQGQGADYETPRSVLKVREEWRISSNVFDKWVQRQTCLTMPSGENDCASGANVAIG